MWRRLAESFIIYEEAVDATLLRYEDLVEGGDAVDRLEALLGALIDHTVLVRRIAGPARRRAGGPTPLELDA